MQISRVTFKRFLSIDADAFELITYFSQDIRPRPHTRALRARIAKLALFGLLAHAPIAPELIDMLSNNV